jgi:hypothetical protein
MDRDDALTAIRPVLDLDCSGCLALEDFQNEVLRPILKFQNVAIVSLAVALRNRQDPPMGMRDALRDSSLRDKLIGIVIGHLTSDELDFYLAHQKDLNRRIVGMVTERITDQLGSSPPSADKARPGRRR